MKKAFYITIISFVLLLGGTVFAVASIGKSAGKEQYVCKNTYGDPSVLDGLELTVNRTLGERMAFTSVLSFQNGTFTSKHTSKPRYGVEISYEEYRLSSNIQTYDYYISKYAVEEELFDVNLTPQQVEDLFIYYPYQMEHRFSKEGDIKYKTGNVFMKDHYVDLLEQEFYQFFRIPFLQDEVIWIDADNMYVDDESLYKCLVTTKYFSINMFGGSVGNAFYFSFNNEASNGEKVDTSLIPGGYGIYKIEYNEKFQPTKLSTILPLDSERTVICIPDAETENRLIFYTKEKDGIYFNLLDVEKEELLQHMQIVEKDFTEEHGNLEEGENSEQTYYRATYIASDNLATMWNEDIAVVMKKDADGTYRVIVTLDDSDAYAEELKRLLEWEYWNSRPEVSSLYVRGDDTLIAVGGIPQLNMQDTDLDFCVAAFQGNKTLYYAEFSPSISVDNQKRVVAESVDYSSDYYVIYMSENPKIREKAR